MKALATLLASAAIALSAPAAAQSFVVTNATVAAGDGSEPIESGYVVVENGKVAAIGSGTPASNLPAIDANGAWVTPGIFATVTSLGLWDVGAVSESNDTRAGGAPFSAALDVAPVINPSSQHILVHRASGITRAATVTLPSSSIFGGQGAVIDLGADPDAVTQARAFQVVALGEYGGRIAGGSRVATHTLLRAALREASAKRAATSADIRSDDVLLTRFDAAALAPVARGEQPLYVYVERASDIRSTLALKREFPKLDLVLVGASEGWLVANEIAAAGVPVIADGLDDLPANFEELAATQSNIGRMVKAGVKVALNAAAMENPRNLNQYAGNLVALTRIPGAEGLSWGQAFAAITSVPASISGMGGKAGVLAPGAMGDLVIWDGDPLEVGSMPVKVYIDGIEQPLDSHQSRLRERYRDLDTSDQPKGYDW
ncbi:amidohydrolase family protein [Qipengyuania flava]|uniref:amidohydrolase family protein n=1 Tax=Qipengyuania flava TaxID=192812 RepID=UPI00141BE28C|nr:amidohydrolase family protein [Qipengyuania flava]NIJ62146.1 imidazolonepropionase-like amidohydrolase [Qipengyuania flava]